MTPIKEIRIGITGSRDLANLQPLREFINKLSPNYTIISGYSGRVDQTAVNLATLNKLRCITLKAYWSNYGRSAGPIRNTEITDSQITHLHAWVADKKNITKGTSDCIRRAIQRGIPVTIHECP